jgi:tricorn protease-like protein
VRPDGSRPVRLGTGTGAALSPDGRWIAFTRQTLARHDLFLMPAQGGTARLIQHGTGVGLLDEPVWSPDSRQLVPIRLGVPSSDRNTLTLIGVPSGRQRVLGEHGADARHVISGAGCRAT